MITGRDVKTIASRPALVAAAVYVMASGSTSASADHEVSWIGPEQYTFQVTHLPDLDQKRTEQPEKRT